MQTPATQVRDEAQATRTRAGKRVDVVDTLEQRGPVDAAEREAGQLCSDAGLSSKVTSRQVSAAPQRRNPSTIDG
jgi:hypothetical protein